MKLHQQFELNMGKINQLGKGLLNRPSYAVEDLVTSLSKKGYTVLKSSAYFMGIPQSITIVKDFTGPFVSHFTSKIKDDVDTASKNLGIRELFV